MVASGGVRPRRGRDLQGRYLSFAEREEIALGRAAGESMRAIAGRLGRSPSTISRELGRNAEAPGRYRATSAHAAAWGPAARPKPAKLATNLVLRGRSSTTWRRGTRRSRSPAGCARSSRTTRRCGCRPEHRQLPNHDSSIGRRSCVERRRGRRSLIGATAVTSTTIASSHLRWLPRTSRDQHRSQ
jgi:hypothetical protein